MRLIIILAALLLVALPVSAQNQVPPAGTGGVVILVSDGTAWLPVSASTFDPTALCEPFGTVE